ncbi:MAG: precorrin-2 C(20)-methyltransferase [Gloeomargarita sp. SKYBB_i_bin120]|nr:precorrin-2 C(20)-methyltransferase [Gloeomargarita sp. SKYG98]MCS7292554.1 precorrin-2 C(20)-methyltransferase [Gloeomargarita sp. SKYB120]MDW8178115.1 precorrin-2 C(20)-methyltransferase [Gloeomargarita sp. SKYBB_i_bin120]
MPGTLYGVGCGPGDPEQITIQAWKLLQQVPVVAVPQGSKPDLGIAAQIVQPWLPASTQLLPLELAFSSDPALTEARWRQAIAQLLVPLQQGLDVAFVCEGDSTFYSTFGMLTRYLPPDIPRRWIPGVCSPCAAAAALGMPLVQQQERLLVVPALYHLEQLADACASAEVVVLLKMARYYRDIWRWLQTQDLLTRSYVVEWVGWPHQKIYSDLRAYPDLDLSYFSLMVIRSSG